MGQIDSEKMYTNVMKWDSNSDRTKYTMIQKPEERVSLTEQILLD
jgi:hypothetical protein